MSRLQDLFDEHGQSPWLDNLRRDWLNNGHLAELVADGVRGVTSNPTIFAKAIEGEDDYDEQFASLIAKGSVEDAYWELVIDDIVARAGAPAAASTTRARAPTASSRSRSPRRSPTTPTARSSSARSLHDRIDTPNLLVKVPATAEGVGAIGQLIAEGLSINVTLIFGLSRYDEVIEAYLSGLEQYAAAGPDDLASVASVASFFVSRVDTEIDRRLETLAGGPAGDKEILALRGKAAVAQAQLAYQHFLTAFSGERWDRLAAKGAQVQRPLWASTSTKNPAYPDLLYVDSLIGPDTVNTMPDATIEAFVDHGVLARTVDADPAGAERVMARLGEVGVDLVDVATTLEDEGVHSFAKSFDELIQALTDKAAALGGSKR